MVWFLETVLAMRGVRQRVGERALQYLHNIQGGDDVIW